MGREGQGGWICTHADGPKSTILIDKLVVKS